MGKLNSRVLHKMLWSLMSPTEEKFNSLSREASKSRCSGSPAARKRDTLSPACCHHLITWVLQAISLVECHQASGFSFSRTSRNTLNAVGQTLRIYMNKCDSWKTHEFIWVLEKHNLLLPLWIKIFDLQLSDLGDGLNSFVAVSLWHGTIRWDNGAMAVSVFIGVPM